MTSTSAGPIREAALKYLWMHNRSWVQTGEEGGPRIVTGGEGVKVVDSDGRTWIDVNGGYNSVNVGYGRTEIAEAAEDQMRRIAFYPVGTAIPSTIELCERLAELTPGTLSRVFPVSGGSEANETALKIARSHAHRNGEPTRYKIISREGSYHGTTGGVLWLGSSAVYKRQDFEPAYPGMVYAPQPNPYRCPLGGTTPSDCAERCARAVEELDPVPRAGDGVGFHRRARCDPYGRGGAQATSIGLWSAKSATSTGCCLSTTRSYAGLAGLAGGSG